ncbi:MAG: phosphatidylserine decarboxylase family protein, partial [Bacteroidetes bacterium HGW-Bacteroidetes-12]
MIHKQGYKIIGFFFIAIAVIEVLIFLFLPYFYLQLVLLFAGILFGLFIMFFFRRPINREFHFNENHIVSGADGRIVAIEKIEDKCYFNDNRIQISVFMSMNNIHINWYPISGEIIHYQYCHGKHLIAKNPKASLKNEMTEFVIKSTDRKLVLMRQIAGMVARRIICNAKEGFAIKQSTEAGIIKFGSRIDLLLPLDVNI